MAKNMTKSNTVAAPFKKSAAGVNAKHGTHGHKPMASSMPSKGCC